MTKHATISVLTILTGAACASAQCVPEWSPHGESQGALAFAVWDADGAGPARPTLVAGGGYRRAPPVQLNMIGTFDGRVWRPLGEGLGTAGSVDALCIAETSGVGSPKPGLYAGGGFSDIPGGPKFNFKRWDGARWHNIPGLRGSLMNLQVFDEDGPGPREPNIFLGGGILEWPGGANAALLRWDGTAFTMLGTGLGPNTSQISVMSSIIFDDDGPGPRPPALYVAGSFETAGGIVVNNIARWDGRNWEPLGFGLASAVRALAVYDADGDGPGPLMLYADGPFRMTPGGNFSTANLSRWDGQQWSESPGYTGGRVTTLAVHDDDGVGPNRESLFIGGFFPSIQGVPSPGIIRWDGSRWHSMDGGVGGIQGAHPNAMGVFDEDGDPATPPGLYVGGEFLTAGTFWTPGLARWGCPLSTCYADCEASTGFGVLDIFDFLCFQNAFVNADPYACDCDTSTGPATCDMLDFLCFQQAFMAGCP
jgi:hypothetical protein